VPRPVHNPHLSQACQALEQLGATEHRQLLQPQQQPDDIPAAIPATIERAVCDHNQENGVYVASGCVATMEWNHAFNNQGGDYGGHVRTGASPAVGDPGADPDEPDEAPDDD
jgi:hypothetical protein